MSDLVAPLLYVMRDETDTFWCFCHLMETLHLAANFHTGRVPPAPRLPVASSRMPSTAFIVPGNGSACALHSYHSCSAGTFKSYGC